MYQKDLPKEKTVQKPEKTIRGSAPARTGSSLPLQTKSLYSPLQLQGKEKPNNTGIPTPMKEQFESLSGYSFDDVQVHYQSDKPAKLQALAYTQGNHVYVGPGQEKHLGHELGHVVQQKQGIVKANGSINGLPLNDDEGLERAASLFSRKTTGE